MASSPLEGESYWLALQRPAVLTKGQTRRLTETLFLPRTDSAPWVRGQLLTRDGSPVLSVPDEPLTLMPGFQYHLCLLAKEAGQQVARSAGGTFRQSDPLTVSPLSHHVPGG